MAGIAATPGFNTALPPAPSMAARQAALGRSEAEGQRQRAAHTIGESTAAAAAAAESAAMPAGWKPSRYFEVWKKEATKTAGFDVYWSSMGHYRIITPDIRKRIVDTILRTTIMTAYESDDFYEGVLASHNDYGAMQAYAAAFVDAFWGYFWADRLGAA